MRNQTELMRSILTNETAQKIIDYVSPSYGDSYVGLWLFQSIGVVLEEIYKIAEQLKYETNPATADLLLDYWEREYGLGTDTSLTKEQRRAKIIAKTQTRGPASPARMSSVISAALGGVEVDITENVAKNTFLVNIRDYVPSIDPAVAVLERIKPAHLTYRIRVAARMVTDAEIKVAIAMTHAEQYRVEVLQ